MGEDTFGSFLDESRHVSVWIGTSPSAAYQFTADPANLNRWVVGLDLTDVGFEFVPRNTLGVLDHVVRLPDGTAFYNPMRVLPAGSEPGRCEVVFTVRRRPGMTDQEFDEDAAAVERDLEALRGLLEG